MTEIAILLFDGITPLDAVGPYEALSRLPRARVTHVATRAGAVSSDGGLALVADEALDDVRAPDVLVVPGGLGVDDVMRDARVLDWIRDVHTGTKWTTSVCTGALILGAAGLLVGKRATTHWNHRESLVGQGAIPVDERVVEDGRIVTAAGVSAGIDMALQLCRRLAGDVIAQAIQLSMEYDPRPPFDVGHPDKAPAEIVEIVRTASRAAAARRRGADEGAS